MSEENRENSLLDAWKSPPEAGAPIGCFATSFTFDSVFFEEECLGRFLDLESDPSESAAAYIIEREEKLSGLVCAVALVDQHHCRGGRSLRWDLLPARLRGGVLHAKVSILHWAGYTRIIIGSANLTPSGYRKNREVFAVLNYYTECETPSICLKETIDFLRTTIEQTCGDVNTPSIQRCVDFFERVVADSRKWGEPEQGRAEVKAFTVFSAPGHQSVLNQIHDRWPYQQQPPCDAYVTSPFFDVGKENRPAIEMWKILRQRGNASLTFNVCGEINDNEVVLQAPKSIINAQPTGRPGVETIIELLNEYSGQDDEITKAYRPVHLKTIWLENDYGYAYLIGSSNFTSKGLGLDKQRNIEANLLFTTNRYNTLAPAYLNGKELDEKIKKIWQETISDETDEKLAGLALLPDGFRNAVYSCDSVQGGTLLLELGKDLPADWQVKLPGSHEVILTGVSWKASGCPTTNRILLKESIPPAGLEVSWPAAGNATAWWPVNAQCGAVLPPPDELKSLSLDDLIEILGSARPLHQLIRRFQRRKANDIVAGGSAEIDPHKRVDTSGFIIQRTRRISWAFRAMREKLEKPYATKESLDWRLYGPVGVQALVHAIDREGQSDSERAFLLAELGLELSRVKPGQALNGLRPEDVSEKLRNFIKTLDVRAQAIQLSDTPDMRDYICNVFKEAGK